MNNTLLSSFFYYYLFFLATWLWLFIWNGSSFRQGLRLAILSSVLFCSTAAVVSPSCAVWVLLLRTVREKMETTASWSFSSTTFTSPSFTSDPSWHSTSSTFRSAPKLTEWNDGLIIFQMNSVALWHPTRPITLTWRGKTGRCGTFPSKPW